MRDTALWALVSLVVGAGAGIGIGTERTADRRHAEALDATERTMRACSDACAADMRRAAAATGRALSGVEWRVERLRDETAAAWGNCAVPGVWHELGVVALPKARGE